MLTHTELPVERLVTLQGVDYGVENVVGVKLPTVVQVHVAITQYGLLTKPAWVDVLVREQMSPSIDSARWALAKAQQSVQNLGTGASIMQRIVQAVQAFTGAGAVAALSRKALRRPGGIGLVALAAGAVVQAFLRHNADRKHQEIAATGEELPEPINERSTPKGRDGGVKTNGR